MRRSTKLQTAPLAAPSGSDELNLAEFPFYALAHRPHQLTASKLFFSDTVYDEQAARQVTRELTVTVSSDNRLPIDEDADVLLALLQLSKADRFASRQLQFSCYQLLKTLGWGPKGTNYDRLEESLHRWGAVTLFYKNSWRDAESKNWETRTIHVLEDVRVRRRKRGSAEVQMELPLCSITWNDTLFRNFQAGHLKQLDWDFYKSLEHPISKRMYRFLDKRFYHTGTWDFELKEFAHTHIGLTGTYDNAQLRRKLGPGIEELQQRSFLVPLPESGRYRQIRRGNWRVVFNRLKETPAPVVKQQAQAEGTPEPSSPIRQLLIDRGVSAAAAAELLDLHSAEKIVIQVDVFDWLVSQNSPKVKKNPPGFLFTSIREDYPPPKGYRAPDERRAEEERAAKERQQRAEQHHSRQNAKEYRERLEDAATAAVQEHVAAYLAALTAKGRQEFEQRALQHTAPRIRRGEGLTAQTQRQLLIDEEVLRVHPLPMHSDPVVCDHIQGCLEGMSSEERQDLEQCAIGSQGNLDNERSRARNQRLVAAEVLRLHPFQPQG